MVADHRVQPLHDFFPAIARVAAHGFIGFVGTDAGPVLPQTFGFESLERVPDWHDTDLESPARTRRERLEPKGRSPFRIRLRIEK